MPQQEELGLLLISQTAMLVPTAMILSSFTFTGIFSPEPKNCFLGNSPGHHGNQANQMIRLSQCFTFFLPQQTRA